MRSADTVPECFQRDGDFDVDAVGAFFGARRAVLLDVPGNGREVEPLVPLSKLPGFVQRRWREYLALQEAKQTPLNGVSRSSGKVSFRVIGGPAGGAMSDYEAPTVTKPSLAEAATVTKPPAIENSQRHETPLRHETP